MSLITEHIRITDVLLYEAGEEINYVRDAITLVSGTPASVTGQILGQITIGTATSAVKASGANTGAGTLVVDVTTPVEPFANVGIYTVRVPVVGTFEGIRSQGRNDRRRSLCGRRDCYVQ